MLSRKIVSASCSSVLLSFLLAVFNPNPLEEMVVEQQSYFDSFLTVFPMYLLYTVPVVLTYGVLTSMISDKVAERLTKNQENQTKEWVISGILHVLFAIVFLPYSLFASLLFFVVDKSIEKTGKEIESSQALITLLLPVIVWLLLMSVIWIKTLY